MTLKTLITTAAATAIIAGSAYAAGETDNRRNPMPDDGVVEGATTYDGDVVVDEAADLQNAETQDRQNPQAVDPVFDAANLTDEQRAAYEAVANARGQNIMFSDGAVLGTIKDFDIDNAGKAEIVVDTSMSEDFREDELVINTGPENIMTDGGQITIASSAAEMSNLAGGDRGAADTRATVILN